MITLVLTEVERDTIYKCLRLMKDAFEIAADVEKEASRAWQVEYVEVCAAYHKINDSLFWDNREARH